MMNQSMRALVILMLFFVSPVYAGEKPVAKSQLSGLAAVEAAWQQRAMVGQIQSALIKKKGAQQTTLERYQYMLESAYALHKTDTSTIKPHMSDKGKDYFRIILITPLNSQDALKKRLFILNYIYDHESGRFLGRELELLPEGWKWRQSPNDPQVSVLDIGDGKLAIYFYDTDPLHATVQSVD